MRNSESKDEILKEISELAGTTYYPTVRGGTVVKEFFEDMAHVFEVEDSGNKIDILKKCVNTVGHPWRPEYDSSHTASGGGGTITVKGLIAVRNALIDKLSLEHVYQEAEIKYLGYVPAPEIYNHVGDFAPGQIDPDLLGDGYERHNKTQNNLAHFLTENGCLVSSPHNDQPRFDILWTSHDLAFVGEVKSTNESNVESQLRTALGQVLRYKSQLASLGINAQAVIILDNPLNDGSWELVLAENGVGLITGPDLKQASLYV
jgi:hypothetical protein